MSGTELAYGGLTSDTERVYEGGTGVGFRVPCGLVAARTGEPDLALAHTSNEHWAYGVCTEACQVLTIESDVINTALLLPGRGQGAE
eukprot:1575774-Rhodomonas_salina.3